MTKAQQIFFILVLCIGYTEQELFSNTQNPEPNRFNRAFAQFSEDDEISLTKEDDLILLPVVQAYDYGTSRNFSQT